MNATTTTINNAQPNPFEQNFSSATTSSSPPKKLSNNHCNTLSHPSHYQQHMLTGSNGNNDVVDVWVSDTSSYTFDSNLVNDSYSSDHQQASSNNASEDGGSSNSDEIFLKNPVMHNFEHQRPKRHRSSSFVIYYNNDPQQIAQQQYQQYQTQLIHSNNITTNTKNKKQKKRHSRTVKVPQDEETRKYFLERNRLAALKYRQRKKQWLSNLQARFECLANNNEQLQMESEVLRKEIMDLKTLLVTHRDCPQYNAFYHQPSSDYNSTTALSIFQ